MKQKPTDDVRPFISRIHQFFGNDLALENEFLRAENRVLRDLLGDKRPKLTERHRRLLVNQ